VVKLLCDAMNGVVYGDDMQIVDLYVSKTYAAAGSTTVMVSMKGTRDERENLGEYGQC
jgi:Holliday junction resolvase RusA-like endonuclease